MRVRGRRVGGARRRRGIGRRVEGVRGGKIGVGGHSHGAGGGQKHSVVCFGIGADVLGEVEDLAGGIVHRDLAGRGQRGPIHVIKIGQRQAVAHPYAHRTGGGVYVVDCADDDGGLRGLRFVLGEAAGVVCGHVEDVAGHPRLPVGRTRRIDPANLADQGDEPVPAGEDILRRQTQEQGRGRRVRRRERVDQYVPALSRRHPGVAYRLAVRNGRGRAVVHADELLRAERQDHAPVDADRHGALGVVPAEDALVVHGPGLVSAHRHRSGGYVVCPEVHGAAGPGIRDEAVGRAGPIEKGQVAGKRGLEDGQPVCGRAELAECERVG